MAVAIRSDKTTCTRTDSGRDRSPRSWPADAKLRHSPTSARALSSLPESTLGSTDAHAERTMAAAMNRLERRLPVEMMMLVIRVSWFGTRAGPWKASHPKPARHRPSRMIPRGNKTKASLYCFLLETLCAVASTSLMPWTAVASALSY